MANQTHEERLARQRAYYAEHKEQGRLTSKVWAAKNPEKVLAYGRAWRERNLARKKLALKAWSDSNRDKRNATKAKRRALKANAQVVEVVNVLDLGDQDQWICGICGEPVDKTVAYPDPKYRTIDHIVPLIHGGDHSYDNVQLAHSDCNSRKGVTTGRRKEWKL